MNKNILNDQVVTEKTEESASSNPLVELQKQIEKLRRSRKGTMKHRGKCAGAFGKQNS